MRQAGRAPYLLDAACQTPERRWRVLHQATLDATTTRQPAHRGCNTQLAALQGGHIPVRCPSYPPDCSSLIAPIPPPHSGGLICGGSSLVGNVDTVANARFGWALVIYTFNVAYGIALALGISRSNARQCPAERASFQLHARFLLKSARVRRFRL